jgi:hypothetical protein
MKRKTNTTSRSTIVRFAEQDTFNVFVGIKTTDHNIKGNFLLIEDSETFYSFNSSDIITEEQLSNGRVKITMSPRSLGVISKPFKLVQNKELIISIFENELPPKPIYKKGDPQIANDKDISILKKLNPAARSFASVAANWTQPNGGCALGNTPPNNCAHYLSDAFIKAGYSELLKRNSQGQGIFHYWCDIITPPNTVNLNARPIRAREMWSWFKTMATTNQTTKPTNSGFWAVFQTDPVYVPGHVLLYDSSNNRVYGTGAYWDWAEQYFYQW